MKQNMVMLDRVIRVFVGIGIFGGAAASGIPWLIALGIIIGLIPIVTGFFGFCPAYILLKRYLPEKPVLSPAEKRHGTRSLRSLDERKLSDYSGSEARMASNRAAFRGANDMPPRSE
jgi:hypothetical protein